MSQADRLGRNRVVPGAASMALAVAMVWGGGAPAFAGDVTRFGGEDRVATAISVYQNNLDVFTGDTVVLTRSDAFADALTATPLAVALKAPVLTTGPNGLDARVLAALKAGGKVKRVIVVGGTGSVSDAIEKELAAQFSTERVAGQDRYETAARVAEKVMQVTGKSSVPVFVASGADFPDALAAGAAAAARGAVILLSKGSELSPQADAFLRSGKASSTTAVGGQAAAAVKQAGVEATIVVGKDRYETAAKLAAEVYPQPKSVVITSGQTYADSLAGAALAALQGAPLVLTTGSSLPPSTQAYLDRSDPAVSLLGGPGAVSDGVARDIAGTVGGVVNPTPQPKPAPVPAPVGGIQQSPFERDLEETYDLQEHAYPKADFRLRSAAPVGAVFEWRLRDAPDQPWRVVASSYEPYGLPTPTLAEGVPDPWRVYGDGSQVQLVVKFSGGEFASRIATFRHVAGGPQVKRVTTQLVVETKQYELGEDGTVAVPVTLTVDGATADEGTASVLAAASDAPWGSSGVSATLVKASESTYTGVLRLPRAGSWRVSGSWQQTSEAAKTTFYLGDRRPAPVDVTVGAGATLTGGSVDFPDQVFPLTDVEVTGAKPADAPSGGVLTLLDGAGNALKTGDGAGSVSTSVHVPDRYGSLPCFGVKYVADGKTWLSDASCLSSVSPVVPVVDGEERFPAPERLEADAVKVGVDEHVLSVGSADLQFRGVTGVPYEVAFGAERQVAYPEGGWQTGDLKPSTWVENGQLHVWAGAGVKPGLYKTWVSGYRVVDGYWREVGTVEVAFEVVQ